MRKTSIFIKILRHFAPVKESEPYANRIYYDKNQAHRKHFAAQAALELRMTHIVVGLIH